MDKFLLLFLKWFSPLFAKQGVDVERLFVIVEVKLQMDKRRTYIQASPRWNRKREEDASNRFLTVLMMYGLFSLIISLMILNLHNIFFSMIFFHGYLLFMMAMTLIVDFSTVMLDTTDNQIILPLPVSGKTLFAARMVHIFIYLLQFAIIMCLLPVAAIFYVYGLQVGLVSIFTSFSTVLLAVFLTCFLYMMVLRFANEQKLKSIITYFQIFMTIFFVISYQLLPRLISFSGITVNSSISNYFYIAPPVWMAGTLEAVNLHNYDSLHIGMILLSVMIPPFLFWFMNKYLSPAFAEKMAMMNSDAGTMGKIRSKNSVERGSTLSEKISRLFCKTSVEQASFQFTWKITGRDKQFRLQFYPSIGYLFVFVFIFIFKGGKDIPDIWNTLDKTNYFLCAIYIPLFMVMTASALLKYNESFRASWVYYSLPVSQPGMLISGALKAIFVKYFVPVFLAFFVLSLAVWGIYIIDDFALGFFVMLSCLFLVTSLSDKNLPFSQEPGTQQQSGRFLRTILQTLIIGILMGLHYLALLYPVILYVLIPVMMLVAWQLVRQVQRTRWSGIFY